MFKSNNEYGFSMVEVLIAISLAVGLSMFLMQMAEQQNKVAKTAEFKGSIDEAHNEIVNLMRRRTACDATFTGLAEGDSVKYLRYKWDWQEDGLIGEMGKPFRNSMVVIESIRLLPLETTGPNASFVDPVTGAASLRLEIVYVKRTGAAQTYGGSQIKKYVTINAKVGTVATVSTPTQNQNSKAIARPILEAQCTQVNSNGRIPSNDSDIKMINDPYIGAPLYFAECRWANSADRIITTCDVI